MEEGDVSISDCNDWCCLSLSEIVLQINDNFANVVHPRFNGVSASLIYL